MRLRSVSDAGVRDGSDGTPLNVTGHQPMIRNCREHCENCQRCPLSCHRRGCGKERECASWGQQDLA